MAKNLLSELVVPGSSESLDYNVYFAVKGVVTTYLSVDWFRKTVNDTI